MYILSQPSNITSASPAPETTNSSEVSGMNFVQNMLVEWPVSMECKSLRLVYDQTLSCKKYGPFPNLNPVIYTLCIVTSINQAPIDKRILRAEPAPKEKDDPQNGSGAKRKTCRLNTIDY